MPNLQPEAVVQAHPRNDVAARLWVTNPARAGLLGWLFRYVLLTALLVLLAAVEYGRVTYRSIEASLPNASEIGDYETSAPGVTRIVASDGSLLVELARENRAYARIDDIPDRVIDAFVAAEDRRFFDHPGIDLRGIGRAVVANLRSGTISQGGSTITQQVAKGFLGDEQTLERKLREAVLAIRLESLLDKRAILEIYLNKIFLGAGTYGVATAAERYFGKRLSELTLAEAALLAGLPKAPSFYSPVSSPERARIRRDIVLDDMAEAGAISAEEAERAKQEPIVLAREPEDVFRWRAPYYAEFARQQVEAELGSDAILSAGLRIETPVVLQYQAHAHKAIDRAVRKLDRRQGWRGPEAHLRDEAARSEFIARAKQEYDGIDWAKDSSRFRLGLVQSVEDRHAEILVGSTSFSLPLANASWAAPYDARSGKNDRTITRLSLALEAGDIVWVRPDHRLKDLEADALTGDPNAATGDGTASAGTRDSISAAVSSWQLELGQTPRMEAALYTVAHDSGYVEMMEGGDDYDRSQFNRSVQSCRQPGSVFKAVYYGLALDGGRYAMDSILEGKPYEPEPGEVWNPRNIDKTIDGKVLLRTSLIRSLNTSSIRLFARLGANNVVTWARKLGIRSTLIADKALALGASCVHMDELGRAFSVHVQGGALREPVYVTRITDKRGRVLVDRRSPLAADVDVAGRADRMMAEALAGPTQVIDERTAFLMTRLLREVVTAGIGGRAGTIGVPCGGKSGTASKGPFTTDTWFSGFTSRHTTVAWMGDDAYERSMGDEDASYTTAIPLWADYMKPVVTGLPHGPVPLSKPPGIGSRVVDATRGGPPVPGFPSATIYVLEEQVGMMPAEVVDSVDPGPTQLGPPRPSDAPTQHELLPD